MSQKHEPEFKEKIVHFHREDGYTNKITLQKDGVLKSGIFDGNGEDYMNAWSIPQSSKEMELIRENVQLRKELEQTKESLRLQKEITLMKEKKESELKSENSRLLKEIELMDKKLYEQKKEEIEMQQAYYDLTLDLIIDQMNLFNENIDLNDELLKSQEETGFFNKLAARFQK